MDLTPANSLTLKKAAIFYAELGFRVFPVRAGGKEPVKGLPWKQSATTDPDVIDQLWSLYPESNIGMVMGDYCGVNCLDVDRKLGQDGYVSYADITDLEYEGPVQLTPSGGEHRFFNYEPGFTNWTRKGVSGGLDMRTDHGYIVVAPSKRPDGRYAWSCGGDTVDAEPKLRIAFQKWSIDKDRIASDAPITTSDVIDYRTLNLKQRYVDYLETGDHSAWESERGLDESAAIFSLAGAVMREVQDEAETFGLLVSNPHVMSCAERHRTHGNPVDWLWQYGIGPMIKEAKHSQPSDIFTPLAMPKPSMGDTPPGTEYPFLDDDFVETAEAVYDPGEDTFFITPDIGLAYYLKPSQWIIQGILEENQVGALYGPSGSFKTFLALDLCLRISLGLDWHGQRTYLKRYCCFVTNEGLGAIWKRIEAWRLRYNLENEESVSRSDLNDSGFVVSKCGVDLLDIESMVPLNTHIHSVGSAPALIVFDTLASNMYGNENSNEDMSRLINHCKTAQAAYGCNVMLVHHSGHSDTGRMRGASALYNNMDYVLQASIQKGAPLTTNLKSTKAKDNAPMVPLSFDMKLTDIGLTEQDGTSSASLVPELAVQQHANVSLSAQRSLNPKQAKFLSCVKSTITESQTIDDDSDPCANSQEIYEAWRTLRAEEGGSTPRRNDTVGKLGTLVGQGHLSLIEDDNGHTWYGLPASDNIEADPPSISKFKKLAKP